MSPSGCLFQDESDGTLENKKGAGTCSRAFQLFSGPLFPGLTIKAENLKLPETLHHLVVLLGKQRFVICRCLVVQNSILDEAHEPVLGTLDRLDLYYERIRGNILVGGHPLIALVLDIRL